MLQSIVCTFAWFNNHPAAGPGSGPDVPTSAGRSAAARGRPAGTLSPGLGREPGVRDGSWPCRSPITRQLAPGTSFQAAGRSPIGSQTPSRVSPDARRRDLPSGIHLPGQADVAGEQQRPRSALAGVAERPQPPAVAGRECALELVLDPSRSPACPGQPGSAHDTRQLRRDLVSGGRAVPSIGGHLARRRPPDRSCRTGPARPATGYIDRWHHAQCPGRLPRTQTVPPGTLWLAVLVTIDATPDGCGHCCLRWRKITQAAAMTALPGCGRQVRVHFRHHPDQDRRAHRPAGADRGHAPGVRPDDAAEDCGPCRDGGGTR